MLTRTRLVVLVGMFVVVAAAIATLTLLPRHYWISEHPSGIAVFWRDDEAFVFIGHRGMGRTSNAALDRLPRSGGWWMAFTAMYADWRSFGQDTTAYRLGSGGLERYELANTVMAPGWDFQDGHLVAMSRLPEDTGQGYRWTGSGFARLAAGVVAPSPSPTAPPSPATGSRTLQADDASESEDEENADAELDFGPVAPPAKERLRGAGWHYKHLSGFEGARQPATLPIPLRAGEVHLTLRSQKVSDDVYSAYRTTVELTGDRLSPHTQVLFENKGWREIPRAEYEARTAAGPFRAQARSFPISGLVLLLLWLGLLIVKFGGLASGILPFFGLKGRLVKGVATTMSFPPAIPEQFPGLDRARLDAFSRDLEGLGFEKLIDTAPVTDSPTHAPSFARVYGHRRHSCFGVLLQMFPSGGHDNDLRCLISSTLDDGWSIGVSNGKPMAASALIRRPRAIGMGFPGLSSADLLARFLAFRDRVCADLGLRPVADTSLAEYIRQTQGTLVEIADAMKKKNIAVGLGQYYSRQMRLASKKSLNVWLGDYPKIAEERRAAGLGPGFTGADLYES